MASQSTEPDPRGYFLSADDADELLRIGRSIGVDFSHWLEDRDRTSWRKRQDWNEEQYQRVANDHDSLCAHLRAVIANCQTSPVDAIRHQLVGLLPECQEMDDELKVRLRENDMGHLVERHEEILRTNWAEYGYGDEDVV